MYHNVLTMYVQEAIMQMDAKHSLQGIIFEWDRRKAAENFRKHKITFESACEAFFDPLVLFLDKEVIDEEIRETILGLTSDWNLFCCIYYKARINADYLGPLGN